MDSASSKLPSSQASNLRYIDGSSRIHKTYHHISTIVVCGRQRRTDRLLIRNSRTHTADSEIFSPTLPYSLTHLLLTYLVASMSTTMPSPPAPETYVPHPTFHYDRDFRGYGEQGLQGLQWPNKAKIAVSFVINYEEVRLILLLPFSYLETPSFR